MLSQRRSPSPGVFFRCAFVWSSKMARSVVSGMCLVVVAFAVGCTKTPPSPSKPTPGKDAGPKAAADSQTTAPAPAVDEKPAAAADTKPATDLAADTAPGGTTKPDMTPPADVAPAAKKLPFEDLVATLGNDRAMQFYRQCEEQLAQNPTRGHERAFDCINLLTGVGMNLVSAGNKEKAMEAFRGALAQAQSIAIDRAKSHCLREPKRCSAASTTTALCVQSLEGKPEDAKATLQKAIELGYSDMDTLRNDPDLAAVRALPGFDQQIADWEKFAVDLVLNSGESFPFDFAVTDLTGQNISLAGYQGKVLIVDIWGTWCGPCKMEIPSFIKLQNEYGSQGFQMVGLNYNENGNDEAAKKDAVAKYVQENGINYPCAPRYGRDSAASAEFHRLSDDACSSIAPAKWP